MIWTDERVKTLKRLVKEGKSQVEIADLMGLSPTQVYSKLNSLKLKVNAIKKPKKKKVKPNQTFSFGKTVSNIVTPPMDTPDTSVSDESAEILNLEIIHLESNQCRWPTKTVGDKHLFCGRKIRSADVAKKRVYCDIHHRKS